MLQVVAGLTVVFVGYVLYEVFKTVSSESSSQPPASPKPPAAVTAATEEAAAKVASPAPKAAAPEPKKAEPTVKKPAPAAGKSEPQAKKTEAATDEEKGLQLRDPKSGETAPAPSNYRFAKKWIKELLVEEGLLDKIYKNADLDDAGSKKVKEALDQLKGMKKYHA